MTCLHMIWNNNQSMKTIPGLVVVIVFAVFFDHPRLAAEDTRSADMRLYPGESIEWKAGPAALPPGAKMAVLEGDPAKEGPFVVRFQFPRAIIFRSIRIQKLSGSPSFRARCISRPEKRSIVPARKNFPQDLSVTGPLA